jgi:hypothetical protein
MLPVIVQGVIREEVDGVVCCDRFVVDVYGEVVGFPCY